MQQGVAAGWRSDQGEITVWVKHDSNGAYQAATSVSTSEGMNLRKPDAFPNTVAGFEFGSNPQAVERACQKWDGSFQRVTTPIMDAFFCTGATVNFLVRIADVGGFFCSERLCELTLHLRDSPTRTLEMLQLAHGAGEPNDSYSMSCHQQTIQYTWKWMMQGGKIGWLRASFDCEPRLTYDNPAGVAWRLEQSQQTHEADLRAGETQAAPPPHPESSPPGPIAPEVHSKPVGPD